jgi:FixJ family two-component response regulator
MEQKKTIALADDDSSIRKYFERVIKKHFKDQEIEVLLFENTIMLKRYLLNNPDKVDLLILDIHFGFGETGIDILPDIKKYSPNLPVILLSAMEKFYGQDITEKAGNFIIDFISKPATETEIVIKIKKIFDNQDDKTEKLKTLQSENFLLSEMLSSQNEMGAGSLFESEVCEKLKSMSKIFMQQPYEPKKNIVINGQEIDVVAFTAPPLPFTVMVFETKYFPNAKLSGGINEPMKIIYNGTERISSTRRTLFEQSENQFKQTSKRIEKILRDAAYAKSEEIYRPFIQSFIVFTDTTDISQIQTSNVNKYTKICKLKDLTSDFIIKTAFVLPKRSISEKVKEIVLNNLF